MKKIDKKSNNKNNTKVKINDYNVLYINLQLITTIGSLILLIVSIFKHSLFPYFFLCLGLTLLSISLNNKYVYNKQDMVKPNLISGILVIVLSLLKIFGVI